jgi:twinkle protein
MTPALYRGLTKDTLDKYSVVFTDKEVIFPYSKDANKHRSLSNKSFYSSGPISDSPLFGKSLFPNGKYITITEGEFDAMSVYQMTGSKYPAISIRGSSSGKMDCKKEFKYLNSFERIYLCFDSDEPGQKAVAEVASLFNPNKVYHVKLNHFKDANDYLVNDAAHLFSSDWWNARPYLPTGIVGDYSSIEDILNTESAKPIATYPYHKLQDMTYGIRSGEVNLFTAQEKVGKTEVMKSLEYHLLTTTDLNIGIIHLEEPEKRTIQGLVGYDLKAPIHLPDHSISTKDTVDTFKKITKRDNRCFLYKHFGSDDPQVILDTIRYLVVACECKVVFLDHITMLVTGFKNEDERKTLDHVSTHLAMMTKELDFTLFLVSHVNDDGKTRGSRNISKIADLIVHMERDIEAESISVRNKTQLLIKGNRYAGLSGPSSTLWFDPSTFTYTELTDENADAILYPESQTPPSKMLEGSDSGSETLWVQASREADTTR